MSRQNQIHRHGQPQAKGYSEAGASLTKKALKGFTAVSGSPNEDIDWNNRTLRQRNRLLYMSSPVATSAINTNRTKVIGVGLTLKSSINKDALGLSPEAAKQWQNNTQAEFHLWANKKENCDAIGINNFAGMQQLALISWLMSGDVFPLFKRYPATPLNPYGLRIHMIEADRISTPTSTAVAPYPSPHGVNGENPKTQNKIFDGVEVDSNGRIVAYHICNNYPGQNTTEPYKWTKVEAYGKKTGLPNILHIMTSERPDQYRGVPYLSPVIEPLLQLRRYTESELMAALVQSFFTAWIKTDTGMQDIPISETGSGDVVGIPGEEPENISESENEYEMGPATVLHLGENESVTFGDPNIPTAGFESFVKTNCRLVGAALDIPYDVLIKEYNASYSASRAALLEAWEAFRMRRTWFVDDFCQPVYEVWLSEAVALGRIKAPGFFTDPKIRTAWCGARWIGPIQGQLDPLKEAKAAVLLTDNAIKTHEQVTREMGGGDWDENVEQLKHENEMLVAAGGKRTVVTLDTSDEEKEKAN